MYVYLFLSSNGLVKIGKTNDLARRYSSLGTMSPIPLVPILAMEVDSVSNLEGILHAKYAAQRINGEWFALSAKDIYDIQRILCDDRPPSETLSGTVYKKPPKPIIIRQEAKGSEAEQGIQAVTAQYLKDNKLTAWDIGPRTKGHTMTPRDLCLALGIQHSQGKSNVRTALTRLRKTAKLMG